MGHMPVRRSTALPRASRSITIVMTIDGLPVTVTRKPIKNMYLRVARGTGEVTVSAPLRMRDGQIAEFVRSRQNWIAQQIARAQTRTLDGGCDSHCGDGASGVGGGQGEGTEEPHFLGWTDERKQQAAHMINAALPGLLAKWGPVIGRTPTHISLRIMSSRWGSCTPKTGRIRLNLQLGLMDPKFLESVLVHEMTHLWNTRGHGPEFQQRMDMYQPNWRQLKRELNRQPIL
ncbi:metal-dependent hydrolase [Bifidobacterium hapali]|uniref:Metal-dependent hydrolase n=2 Tax=Bifidobacterium hapali TaxID=1630172 RepID=A0A261FWT3_9BIFI|nr:metal-dependent hydrolase [Bifidobacterium hapali]